MKDGEVGGAIYVYINKKGQWNNAEHVRIDGAMDSMFGLAVEHIGDVNLDTYAGLDQLLSVVYVPHISSGHGRLWIFCQDEIVNVVIIDMN